MEIHVQMRAVNLYTLTRKIEKHDGGSDYCSGTEKGECPGLL